jgi:hypothetical protein
MMVRKGRRHWGRSSFMTVLLMTLELWWPPPLLPSERLGRRRKCLGPLSHIPVTAKVVLYLITRVQSYGTRAILAYETQELGTNLDTGPAVAWRRPCRYSSTWSWTRCRPTVPSRSTRPSREMKDDIGRARNAGIASPKVWLNRRRAMRGMAQQSAR